MAALRPLHHRAQRLIRRVSVRNRRTSCAPKKGTQNGTEEASAAAPGVAVSRKRCAGNFTQVRRCASRRRGATTRRLVDGIEKQQRRRRFDFSNLSGRGHRADNQVIRGPMRALGSNAVGRLHQHNHRRGRVPLAVTCAPRPIDGHPRRGRARGRRHHNAHLASPNHWPTPGASTSSPWETRAIGLALGTFTAGRGEAAPASPSISPCATATKAAAEKA